MSRSLAALALVALATVPAPAHAAITPGCDRPVDVACNMAWSPDNPSTPQICVLYVDGRCVVR
ncbi:MAG TPA: hypothetical protein VGX28_09685 [Frankiaceae bacterium]|jgi:hypothetical protein|nr:hypothetical protein [Frankiaceae bacterium]